MEGQVEWQMFLWWFSLRDNAYRWEDTQPEDASIGLSSLGKMWTSMISGGIAEDSTTVPLAKVVVAVVLGIVEELDWEDSIIELNVGRVARSSCWLEHGGVGGGASA